MTKYIKRALVFGALGVLGMLVVGNFASAAADTTLTGAIASSTGFFDDNLAVIVSFVIDIILKLAGVVLAFGAIYWVYKKIRSIFRNN